MSDIPTPLKRAVPQLKEIETNIEAAMASKFGFEYPFPELVYRADRIALKLEKEGVKKSTTHWPVLDHVIVDIPLDQVNLDPLLPEAAHKLFVQRYRELKP